MKTLAIILIAVLALAIGIYYFTAGSVRQIDRAHIAIIWATYRNNQYGFTINYPSIYSIVELREPITTKYNRHKFINIVDTKDTSTYEFHVVPAAIAIIKGNVYHNLEEYIHAGFGQGGDDRTEGELVSINGVNALHFHYRTVSWPFNWQVFNWQEDAPFERYVIIRNDLIYQIDLKTDDPFRDEFLRSFNLL
jgi:hypothetical protein